MVLKHFGFRDLFTYLKIIKDSQRAFGVCGLLLSKFTTLEIEINTYKQKNTQRHIPLDITSMAPSQNMAYGKLCHLIMREWQWKMHITTEFIMKIVFNYSIPEKVSGKPASSWTTLGEPLASLYLVTNKLKILNDLTQGRFMFCSHKVHCGLNRPYGSYSFTI